MIALNFFGRCLAMVALPGILLACSSGALPAPVGAPVPDAEDFAQTVRARSVPAAPLQINFGWTLEEGGSRVSGRGVVRMEAPRRSRLDLFGPRGETYITAALVDGEYRLPPAAAGAVVLPSPALLWAAIGIVEPPPGSSIVTATSSGPQAELRYSAPGGDLFVYSLTEAADGRFLLAQVERAGSRGVLETVGLERDPAGAITRTRYRDWANFRDLTLEVETIRDMPPFPPNIWSPDAPTP